MSKISLLLLLIVLSAGTAEASFFSPKYDIEYLPYNHTEASAVKSKVCNSVLDQYDKLYDELDRRMALHIKEINSRTTRSSFVVNWDKRLFLNEMPIKSFSELKTVTEEAIRDCLVTHKDTQAEKEKEQNKKEQREKAKDRLAKRQTAIQDALLKCDMEFLARLNEKEKMQTFKERQVCTKNKSGNNQAVVKNTSNTDLILMLMKQIELLTKQLELLKSKNQ